MKFVSEEAVLLTHQTAKEQLQVLVDNTDMKNGLDRKRTNNFCEWIGIKTQFVLDEKHFSNNNNIIKSLHRGHVVWVEFGFNIGVEFGGRHPAIILYRDNETAYVVPLSSQKPHEIKKYHVEINKIYGFKTLTRWANVSHIKRISLQRIDISATIGNVKGDVLDKINDAIKVSRLF